MTYLVQLLAEEGLLEVNEEKISPAFNTSTIKFRRRSLHASRGEPQTSSSSQLTNQLSTLLWSAFFPPRPSSTRIIPVPTSPMLQKPISKRPPTIRKRPPMVRKRPLIPSALRPIVCLANESSSLKSQPQPKKSRAGGKWKRNVAVVGLFQFHLLFFDGFTERFEAISEALRLLFLESIPGLLQVFSQTRALEVSINYLL